jgi:hypothetical protein
MFRATRAPKRTREKDLCRRSRKIFFERQVARDRFRTVTFPKLSRPMASATSSVPVIAATAPAKTSAVTVGAATVATPEQWAAAVREVAGIASHPPTLASARSAGMSIVSVAWEDTGRASGSSGGPHITDVTLRLADGGPRLPIIRGSSNYEDGKTCDLKIEYLSVLVGNELPLVPGAPVPELRRIPFAEYLRELPKYVAGGAVQPMLAARDTVILVSPQYCVIPVDVAPQPFAPDCKNYGSSPQNPGVMYVFASVYGTSTQVVTESGAQTLMVNEHGRRHALQAMRLDEDRKARGKTTTGAMDAEEKTRNVMHLYQIPLKQQVVHRYRSMGMNELGGGGTFSFGGGAQLETMSWGSKGKGGGGGKEGKKSKSKAVEYEECEEEEFGSGGLFGESSAAVEESLEVDEDSDGDEATLTTASAESLRAKTNVTSEVKEAKQRKGMIDAVLSIDPTDRGEFPIVRGRFL